MAEQQQQIESQKRESQRLYQEVELLKRWRRPEVSQVDLAELREYIDKRLTEIADAKATSADHRALAGSLRDISRQLRDLSQQFYASEQEGAQAFSSAFPSLSVCASGT